jgi:hypothetical protein
MRRDPDTEHDGTEPNREDEDFARQVGAVLRTSERPGADFDERVMAAVRKARSAPSASMLFRLRPRATVWRRPRVVALPLAAWGAIAASFAAMVSLGTLSIIRMTGRSQDQQHVASMVPASTSRVRPATAAQHDTVYVVRFVLADAQARTVTLVGDFNAWAKRATPLRPSRPGIWSTQVALPPGRHEYAFVVDGKHWVADPSAERLADDFDTPSSVITVGADGVLGN